MSPITSARRSAQPPSTQTPPATPPHPPSSDPHRGARHQAPAADPAFAAVIFDMDGVVTDTAGLHAAAWQALFFDSWWSGGLLSHALGFSIGQGSRRVDSRTS